MTEHEIPRVRLDEFQQRSACTNGSEIGIAPRTPTSWRVHDVERSMWRLRVGATIAIALGLGGCGSRLSVKCLDMAGCMRAAETFLADKEPERAVRHFAKACELGSAAGCRKGRTLLESRAAKEDAMSVPPLTAVHLWDRLEEIEFERALGLDTTDALDAFTAEFLHGKRVEKARLAATKVRFRPVAEEARRDRSLIPLLAFAEKFPEYGLEQSLLLEIGVQGQSLATLQAVPRLLAPRMKHLEQKGGAGLLTLRGLVDRARIEEASLAWTAASSDAETKAKLGQYQAAVVVIGTYRKAYPGSSAEALALDRESGYALEYAKESASRADTAEDAARILANVARAYSGTRAANVAEELQRKAHTLLLDKALPVEAPDEKYTTTEPPDPVYQAVPPKPSDDHVWTDGEWGVDEDDALWSWTPGAWRRPPSSGLYFVRAHYEIVDGKVLFVRGHWTRDASVVRSYGGLVIPYRVAVKSGLYRPGSPIAPRAGAPIGTRGGYKSAGQATHTSRSSVSRGGFGSRGGSGGG